MAGLLALILLAGCLISDWAVANSALTLPMVIAALVTAGVMGWGVPRLRQLKLGQVIREEGPQGHHSKAGTPTMGGLLAVPVGVLVGSWISPGDPRLLAIAAITLAYMAVGAVDDWRSLTKRTNTGLTPRAKLLLQAGAALLFLLWAALGGWLGGGVPGDVGLPLGWVLPLGLLIWPLGLFVFLAESNATNLTDGLDGLAGGCGAVVFTGMGLQLMVRGNEGDPVLAGFCAAMAGCWLRSTWARTDAVVTRGPRAPIARYEAIRAVTGAPANVTMTLICRLASRPWGRSLRASSVVVVRVNDNPGLAWAAGAAEVAEYAASIAHERSVSELPETAIGAAGEQAFGA